MLFGIFGNSSPKNSVDAIKDIFKSYDKLIIAKKPSEKSFQEKLTKYFTKFSQIVIDEIKKEKESYTQLEDPSVKTGEFFSLASEFISKVLSLALQNSELSDSILKSITSLIKEAKIKSRIILSDTKVINSIKTLLCHLDSQLQDNSLENTTKLTLSGFLSEICRLFFSYPELLNNFKIMRNDKWMMNYYEDFVIFSNLLNLFKTDQLIKEYENRKMIRRSIIVCLSFDEVTYSSYLENDSFLCEIIVEKLCTYYQMLPSYFELAEDCQTLEVAYNLKATFNILLSTYLEFRDYVFFFNKVCNTIRSTILKGKLKIVLFNKFLIYNIQDGILSDDLRVVRSTLQYLVFIIRNIKNNEIISVFYNFLFGFNDKTSRATRKTRYEIRCWGDHGEPKLVKIHPEPMNSSVMCGEDFDYARHSVVDISIRVLNNLNTTNESLNIISYTLFELFFEKCPYIMIHKFILPFSEFCLRQIEDPARLLGTKTYPYVQHLYQLVAAYEKRNFDFDIIADNLEMNLYKSYSYYINNDIDFYYYYLNERQDQENFDYLKTNDNGLMRRSIHQEAMLKGCEDIEILEESLNIPKEESNINKNCAMNERNIFSNSINLNISNSKFNFSYFKSNKKQKINIKNKLFDELDEIEEEFGNVNIDLMKSVLQKLANFMNNTTQENLFLTNLVLTILSIPCLEFDPVLVFCHSLLLDEDINSNFSLLKLINFQAQEVTNMIKSSDNFDTFLRMRLEELKVKDTDTKQPLASNRGITQNSKKLSKTEMEFYKREIPNLDNIIIFLEFLKEFLSIITHKFHFENIVEEIYTLYSLLLDEYYTKSIS